ncbi:DUF6153 family protein [Streptomyces sp. NPDC004623]|uniref:DUF6153 family protein n=1 Tax=Streptomyces sp. NPDC004623 TaxID=3156653 RepID=UPI0033BF8C5A
MSCAVQPPSRRPAGRGFVLLVLAVLAGMLAMHGLAPGPAPAKAAVPASAHAVMAVHEKAGEMAGDSSHAVGRPGHARHADATCAAAGVGAPYAPPPLTSAPGIPLVAQVLAPGASGAPEGGRAPPDLAELQLLRI